MSSLIDSQAQENGRKIISTFFLSLLVPRLISALASDSGKLSSFIYLSYNKQNITRLSRYLGQPASDNLVVVD